MHPKIATLVSDISYNGHLVTAPVIVKQRKRLESVLWINHQHPEESPGGWNTSKRNVGEAREVCEVAKREMRRSFQNKIMVITFYKAQMFEIMDCF